MTINFLYEPPTATHTTMMLDIAVYMRLCLFFYPSHYRIRNYNTSPAILIIVTLNTHQQHNQTNES